MYYYNQQMETDENFYFEQFKVNKTRERFAQIELFVIKFFLEDCSNFATLETNLDSLFLELYKVFHSM